MYLIAYLELKNNDIVIIILLSLLYSTVNRQYPRVEHIW